MLKTFALRGRGAPERVRPRGLQSLLGALRRVFGTLTYPLEVVELRPGEELGRDEYAIVPFAVHHGGAGLGYALVERERPGRFDVDTANRLGVPDGRERGLLQRVGGCDAVRRHRRPTRAGARRSRAGRKVVLTGDTAPADGVEAAAAADLLVHEATFCADEVDRARETLHSTAAQAAVVAQEAGVRLLALTHLSSRYPGSAVAAEAQAVFPATVVPRDFDVIEVPFPERGEPVLVRKGRVKAALG